MAYNARGTTSVLPEMIAALMLAPRTQQELGEYVGTSVDRTRAWLKVLRARGLVYRAGKVPKEYDENGNRPPGKCPVLWALQPKPLQIPDAV